MPRKNFAFVALFASALVVACDNTPEATAPANAPSASVVADEARVTGWYERTWPEVMAQAGTVWSDFDETQNKIVFGIERAGVANAVAAIMRARGVPTEAYEVRVVPPVQNLAHLQTSSFRPTQGGIQIHFTSYLCTLGFNVNTSSGPGFVTNSHCTGRQGGVENTLYYQPTSSASPTAIARETKDPTYFKNGACPKGKQCRYSDSSLALYINGTLSAGLIAQTTGPNNGSLTTNGTFSVSGTGTVGVGATVNKVGRTTGWTQGQVTQTCVNTSVQGGNIMQLCQSFVSAGVGSGDSGSPVFSGNGTIVGILWGGSGSSLFVFSPISAVQNEVGPFTLQ